MPIVWSQSDHWSSTGGPMPIWTVWILLLAKHALLTHMVDAGYSYSRDPRNRSWPYGLVLLVVLEFALTTTVMLAVQYPYWRIVCVLELLLVVGTCLAERRAGLHHMLQVHLGCEFLMIGFYGGVAWAVSEL